MFSNNKCECLECQIVQSFLNFEELIMFTVVYYVQIHRMYNACSAWGTAAIDGQITFVFLGFWTFKRNHPNTVNAPIFQNYIL